VNARSLIILCAVLPLAGCGGEHLLKPAPLALVTRAVLAQVHAAPDSIVAAGAAGEARYLRAQRQTIYRTD
jgi:hypothetical protein